MTMSEARKVAAVLKDHRPDPVAGTIGERMLWGTLVRRMAQALSQRGVVTRWNHDQWCEAAGLPDEER